MALMLIHLGTDFKVHFVTQYFKIIVCFDVYLKLQQLNKHIPFSLFINKYLFIFSNVLNPNIYCTGTIYCIFVLAYELQTELFI